jgi:hypothetical protein
MFTLTFVFTNTHGPRYNEDCGMTKVTYHHFINEMNAFVRSKNRTMIVWEGFDPNPGTTAEPIDKNVIVSPFDSVHLTPWPHRPHHYYDAGYNIVNTDWNPLYLVQVRARTHARTHTRTNAHTVITPKVLLTSSQGAPSDFIMS